MAYTAATKRLQDVLDEARRADTYDLGTLEQVSAFSKLNMCINSGGLVMLLAVGVCWLCGEDPKGGMDLQWSTLLAALAGVVWSVPLLAASAAAHSPEANQRLPLLHNVHDAQQQVLVPLMRGLDPVQVAIVLSCMVAPNLLLLLPATKAVMDGMGDFIFSVLLVPFGHNMHLVGHGLPAGLRYLLPSLPGALLAAELVIRNMRVNDSQLDAIRDGVSGAERYFRHSMAARVDVPVQRAQAPPPAMRIASMSGAVAEAPLTTYGSTSGAGVLGSFAEAFSSMSSWEEDDVWQAAYTRSRRSFEDQIWHEAFVSSQRAAASSMSAFAAGAAVAPSPLRPSSAPQQQQLAMASLPAASPAKPMSAAQAKAASEAMRNVAAMWLLTQRQTAHLAGGLAAANVAFCCLMWQATGDMATPLVAAMLHAGLETWYCCAPQRSPASPWALLTSWASRR